MRSEKEAFIKETRETHSLVSWSHRPPPHTLTHRHTHTIQTYTNTPYRFTPYAGTHHRYTYIDQVQDQDPVDQDQDPVDQDQDPLDKDQDQDPVDSGPGPGGPGPGPGQGPGPGPGQSGARRSQGEQVSAGAGGGQRGRGPRGPPTADGSIQVTHLVNQSTNASDTTINK